MVEAEETKRYRMHRWSMAILLLAFAFMSCWMILFRPLHSAVSFSVIDDAMYYVRVAQNMASTGVCTYDGVTSTNGFHPLWLLLLLPLYSLVHDPFVALQFVFVYVFTILLVCCFLLAKISKHLQLSVSGLFVMFFVVLLNLRSFTLFYGLLESHVVLLTYLAYVLFALKAGPKRFTDPRHAFFTGLLIGTCFLARLDSFILAIALGLMMLWHTLSGPRQWLVFLKAAASAALGCLLLVVPYLLTNVYSFGHMSTVSAYVKSNTPSLQFGSILWDWFFLQFISRLKYVLGLGAIPSPVIAAALIGCLVAGLVFVARSIRRKSLGPLAPATDFILFAVLHLVFICLVAPGEAAASIWYLVPEILVLGLLLGVYTPDIRVLRFRAISAGILLLLVAQIWIYPSFLSRKTMTRAKLEIADYIRMNIPVDARLCMYDSGIVSYFSQRDFVSLNGLIGDFEMADLVKQQDRNAIAGRYKLEFIVLDTPTNILPLLTDHMAWKGAIVTKFTDFQEAEKPFVLYRITPETLGTVWDVRYGIR